MSDSTQNNSDTIDSHNQQNSNSGETDFNNGELLFYYNRADRLKKAPEVVQKSYNGELPTAPKGIFEALVHTKSSRFLLIGLVVVLVATVGIILLGKNENVNSINSVEYNISAFSFEDQIYVSIQPKVSKQEIEQSTISIQIQAIDADNQVVNQKDIVKESITNDEFIRTIFTDYDIIKISAKISVNDEQIEISCPIEKK